jgi:hypothetical protein
MYFELFNQKSEEFVSELITAYPDIVEFKKFKTGIRLLTSINIKTPQMMFKKNQVASLKDNILKKNEDFFMNFDIKSDTKHSNDYDEWVDFINRLKSIWINLDETNKETIWKYFRVLVLLSDKCG